MELTEPPDIDHEWNSGFLNNLHALPQTEPPKAVPRPVSSTREQGWSSDYSDTGALFLGEILILLSQLAPVGGEYGWHLKPHVGP